MLLPGTADAQDAAPPKERERLSFVYFAPNRLGLLVPINDRWLVRGDLGGSSYDYERNDNYFYAVASGVSLIRRSSSSERDWGYAALRYGNLFADGASGPHAWTQHSLGLSFGGQAQLVDWLAVFGEAGPAVSYREGDGSQGYEVDVAGSLSMVLGVALRRPTRNPTPRATSAPVDTMRLERPSWVIDGYGTTGVLIPLTQRWLLRPDIGFLASAHRPSETSEIAGTAGLSLLRRTRPSDQGWVYAALRYGVEYDQYRAQNPTWTRVGSLTLGAHVRLSERLGAFGEAGQFLKQERQQYVDGLFKVSSLGFIHSVGLTFRWKDRRR